MRSRRARARGRVPGDVPQLCGMQCRRKPRRDAGCVGCAGSRARGRAPAPGPARAHVRARQRRREKSPTQAGNGCGTPFSWGTTAAQLRHNCGTFRVIVHMAQSLLVASCASARYAATGEAMAWSVTIWAAMYVAFAVFTTRNEGPREDPRPGPLRQVQRCAAGMLANTGARGSLTCRWARCARHKSGRGSQRSLQGRCVRYVSAQRTRSPGPRPCRSPKSLRGRRNSRRHQLAFRVHA